MKRFLLVLPLLAAVGCSSNTTSFSPVGTASNNAQPPTSSTRAEVPASQAPADATSSNGAASDAPAANAPAGTSVDGAKVPPGMAMSERMTLTPTPDLDKKIASALKTNDKKKISAAYAERGTFRMNDTSASPKVIYRAALQDYRVALKNDASNGEAKTNKALIESIYTSMGRPIPSV